LPASYTRDVFVPLVVLGASPSIALVVLTPEAVPEVEPPTNGAWRPASSRNATHLFGGAVGVALYDSVLTATSTTASDADGYRAAFLAATSLACSDSSPHRRHGPVWALPLSPSTLIADAGESHSEDPLRNTAAAELRHAALRGEARAERAIR
jgi:hypothetical protein